MQRRHVPSGVLFAALAVLFLAHPVLAEQCNHRLQADKKAAEAFNEYPRYEVRDTAGKVIRIYLTPDASEGSLVVFKDGCVIGWYGLTDWSDVVGGNDT